MRKLGAEVVSVVVGWLWGNGACACDQNRWGIGCIPVAQSASVVGGEIQILYLRSVSERYVLTVHRWYRVCLWLSSGGVPAVIAEGVTKDLLQVSAELLLERGDQEERRWLAVQQLGCPWDRGQE